MKTIAVSNADPLTVNGVTLNISSVEMIAVKLIQYHLRRLSETSTIGPSTNLKRLADAPTATIAAVCATEKPLCVNK